MGTERSRYYGTTAAAAAAGAVVNPFSVFVYLFLN